MSITESYRRYIQEPSGTHADILVRKFARHLQKLDGPWLAVFDNVEDVDAFEELGPEGLQLDKGHGSFLLTTRYNPYRIPILRTSTGRFKAIDLGHYDETFEDYLSQLSEPEHEYISCLASLDGDGISIDLLEECRKLTSLNMSAEDARDWLKASALVHHSPGGEFKIHRLVRSAVLNKLQHQDKLARTVGLAMDAVANLYFAQSYMEQKVHESADPYARHVEAIMQVKPNVSHSSLEALAAKARLFHARGTFLLSNGMPTAAEEPLRISLGIYDKLPSSRHHQLALVSRLATACREQGRQADAEQLEARFQEAEIRPSRHWERVKGIARVGHSKNEAEDQDADEVEIESVLSNLPSLTAGSTISSALTLAFIEDIKADVLTILTKDQ